MRIQSRFETVHILKSKNLYMNANLYEFKQKETILRLQTICNQIRDYETKIANCNKFQAKPSTNHKRISHQP